MRILAWILVVVWTGCLVIAAVGTAKQSGWHSWRWAWIAGMLVLDAEVAHYGWTGRALIYTTKSERDRRAKPIDAR